jgi:hypothetical protein
MLDPQFRTSEEHPPYIHACPPICCCNAYIPRLPVPRYIPTRESSSHLHEGQVSRKPHLSRTGKQVVDIDLFPHHLDWDPYASRMILLTLFSLFTPRPGSDLVRSPRMGASYLWRLPRVPLPNPFITGQEIVSCPETEGSRGPEDFQLVRS